jgi:hypothetical protein
MQIVLEDTIKGLYFFLKKNKFKIKNASIIDIILSIFQKGIILSLNREDAILGLNFILNEINFIIPDNVTNLILTINSIGNTIDILPLIYDLNLTIFKELIKTDYNKTVTISWFSLIEYLRKLSSINDNDIKLNTFSIIQKILLDKNMLSFSDQILYDLFHSIIFLFLDQFLDSNNNQSKYKVLEFLSKTFCFLYTYY